MSSLKTSYIFSDRLQHYFCLGFPFSDTAITVYHQPWLGWQLLKLLVEVSNLAKNSVKSYTRSTQTICLARIRHYSKSTQQTV